MKEIRKKRWKRRMWKDQRERKEREKTGQVGGKVVTRAVERRKEGCRIMLKGKGERKNQRK